MEFQGTTAAAVTITTASSVSNAVASTTSKRATNSRPASSNETHELGPENDADISAVIDDDDDDDDDDDGGQPKQPRLMHACDVCRRKKIKCDGSKPSCSHCTRLKLACHYSPFIRKKRNRRSTVDKLEDRMLMVEQMMFPTIEVMTFFHTMMQRGQIVILPHPPSQQQQQQQQPQPIPYNSNCPQTVNSSIESLAPTVQPSESTPISSPSGFVMPPPDVVNSLIDTFCHISMSYQHPIVSRILMNRYPRSKLPEYLKCAILANGARHSPLPMFSSGPRYLAGRAFAERAAHLVSTLVDKPEDDVIVTLLYLGLYEYACGRGDSAWTFTGLALRLAERAKLHLTDDSELLGNTETDVEPTVKEWHRRLWWACFTADRISVMTSARPATISEADFTCKMPSQDYEWIYGTGHKENSVTALSSSDGDGEQNGDQSPPDATWIICELYVQMSRICQFVNRRRRPTRSGEKGRRETFDALAADLEQIMDRLPSYLSYPPQSQHILNGITEYAQNNVSYERIYSVYVTIHMLYTSAKIILYRSELPTYFYETVSLEKIEIAKKVCVEAAHRQAEIIEWCIANIPPDYWDTHLGAFAFHGSSIHVNACHSTDADYATQAKQDLETHIKFHLLAGKYYFYNSNLMSILRTVNDIRHQQQTFRSSAPSQQRQLSLQQARIYPQHPTDPDPWVVPIASSYEGFLHNCQKVRSPVTKSADDTLFSQTQQMSKMQISESQPRHRHHHHQQQPQQQQQQQQQHQPQPHSSFNSVSPSHYNRQVATLLSPSSRPQEMLHYHQNYHHNQFRQQQPPHQPTSSLPPPSQQQQQQQTLHRVPTNTSQPFNGPIDAQTAVSSQVISTSSPTNSSMPLQASTSIPISFGNIGPAQFTFNTQMPASNAVPSDTGAIATSSGSGKNSSRNDTRKRMPPQVRQIEHLQKLEDLRSRIGLVQQLDQESKLLSDPQFLSSAQKLGLQTDPASFINQFSMAIGSIASQLSGEPTSAPMPAATTTTTTTTTSATTLQAQPQYQFQPQQQPLRMAPQHTVSPPLRLTPFNLSHMFQPQSSSPQPASISSSTSFIFDTPESAAAAAASMAQNFLHANATQSLTIPPSLANLPNCCPIAPPHVIESAAGGLTTQLLSQNIPTSSNSSSPLSYTSVNFFPQQQVHQSAVMFGDLDIFGVDASSGGSGGSNNRNGDNDEDSKSTP